MKSAANAVGRYRSARRSRESLALAEQIDGDLTDFYLACAEYMVFSMDRLHEQD